jgi:hypothetical protein
MKLHITPTRIIQEVQTEFNRTYPYLKLEFFDKSCGYHRLPADAALDSCPYRQLNIPDIPEGDVEISDRMTVYELESQLQDHFRLSAQVFRKSGNIWMETTRTDHWTLRDQNEHGKEISKSA